jgi:CRISPR/Cas system CSM-associated protein Csm2 small subunit
MTDGKAVSKSKVAKKRAKLYSGNDRNLPNMGEALMQIRAEKQDLDEASGDKEAYKKFFDAALKKFKVSSPAELKGDQKKKFYDYIDKNWEADNEKTEDAMSQVREFKIQSMKAALAQVWGMEEGKNPFKAEDHDDDDEEMKKKVKTETGKKPAKIDLKPKIDDR